MSYNNSSGNILKLENYTHMLKGTLLYFLINFHPMGEPETFICGVTKGDAAYESLQFVQNSGYMLSQQ